ncbi:MAG TPA: hypothetical protein VHC19_12645 [Pirellulales bacterium]|nr:hypothetical protein [Pirellulales bacterium]
MRSLAEQIDAWVIALGFAASMLAAWGAGWKRQRRLPLEQAPDPGIKFTDAGMALLGLLLGFTFSMALGRHEQRRAMAIADSNAIGDFYTCASLLREPHRTRLQAVVRDYTLRRLSITRAPSSAADFEQGVRDCEQMHERMTELVAGALAVGTPIAVSLANTLNGVTSSHAARLAAYRERLPWSIVALLFTASVVPAFLMGLQQGVSQKPHLSGTFSFVLLVSMVTFVTLDLNEPGRGLIRVSQEPMERLARSMSE